MKRKNGLYTILGILLLTLSLIFVFPSQRKKEVYADTSCPPGMTLLECYSYYQSQANNLKKQQSSVQQKLKNEEYQQLSLNEKIKYIQTQISETTVLIQTIQTQITAEDVAIRILEGEIQEKEDSVSILKQEIKTLKDLVNERITEAYKYSFLNQFGLFLDFKNISSIIRRIKYLEVTRVQDKELLEQHLATTVELKVEEEKLLVDKAKMEKKKEEIEKERDKLADAKKELDGQKAEQNSLLAQSKRREALYLAQLKQVMSALNQSEKATADLYSRLEQAGLFKSGRQVAKGEIIGFQGHTGCSFGSHLHYQLRKGTTILNPKNYLNGTDYGEYVTNGIYQAPLRSGLVTNDFLGGHNAIDIVSKAEGNQSWTTYTVPYGLCGIVDGILNARKKAGMANWNQGYLNGEGAPVRASTSGSVSYCYDDYGATWARLKHNTDANTSWYVHLQPVTASSYDCICSKKHPYCKKLAGN